MDITQHPGSDVLELRLTGRLDATWADHLSGTIETAVRGGSHQIALNFAGVDYISSLGIRVLLNHYKRLKAVNGSLSIAEPSEATLIVLKAAGLAAFLLSPTAPAAAAPARAATTVTRAGATYQIFPQAVANPLSWRVIGHPDRLRSGVFADTDCHTMAFKNGSFGLGLGAFGNSFSDCRDGFGDFLAAGGCAVTLPTNNRHALPDYVIEEGTLVPSVQTLYAIAGSGDFSSMVRFDAAAEGSGTVGLSALVEALVEFSDAAATAFVVLAETASLVGAILRQSPATGPVSLELPAVRDWLSFTTERSSERSLALLVGFAARDVPTDAAAFLRPMRTESPVQAHIHAAVFPYRPVQRGEIPFGKTISDVLAASAPNAVMHLMADTRPFEGVGETDLVRGACWMGSLATIARG
jgi:anti-anti-sigma factor